MKFVSAHHGVLRVDPMDTAKREQPSFVTGLAALDALAPGGAFARGVIHELLANQSPLFMASMIARAAASGGYVVWSDPRSELYPPALAAMGLSLDRLLVLRTADPADELWGVAECLRCEGVAATIASPERLSRVQARRLQLAAEHGGGVGILLRQGGRSAVHYAAATRWRVDPTKGEVGVQCWRVELIHGHGGRIGVPVIVEACRETNHVRAIDAVAGRSAEAETGRASA
jgi:protein ImuA